MLVGGFLWFWLSGELFRPRGKTPVELTVLDTTGQPMSGALLRFTQSGERMVIPIPFGPSRHVESHFEHTTDAKGFCRFTFTDQHCELTEVSVAGSSRKMVQSTEFRGEASKTEKNPRPSWLLAAPPYVYVLNLTISSQ